VSRAALAVALLALLALAGGGCGGGGETVDEASQAVAGLIASEDCVRLMDAAGAVPLALGGAVSSSAGTHAEFLADFATRAPRELAGDVAVVQGALAGLAGGQEVAAPQQALVRAAAARLGAWARSSCPG
jgi:hypothetical protein